MKNISFRIRNFEKEQFLTFNIDNEAELDEDLLDYLEEEEPIGVVPVIFEEGEEFDTFSYDITDKIRVNELSEQEINAEMVLMVLRGLVISLMNMSEYRIPLSYLVLNRKYIYIDSEYRVEFVCIPIEDMKEEVDLTHFFRNFIASLRFDSSENGDYVAKLLTYVNNKEMFNLHNMLSLVEEWMDNMGIDIPEGESGEIYGEYQEVEEAVEEVSDIDPDIASDDTDKDINNILDNIDAVEELEDAEDIDNVMSDLESSTEVGQIEDDIVEEPIEIDNNEEVIEETDKEAEEDAADESITDEETVQEPENEEQAVEDVEVDADEADSSEDDFVESETQEDLSEETVDPDVEEQSEETESETEEEKQHAKKSLFKTKEAEPVGVVIEDDFDEFLAEKEREDQAAQHDDSGLKIKKNIKINRASIVKNTQEELKAAEEDNADEPAETGAVAETEIEEVVEETEGKDKENGSIIGKTIENATNSIKNATSSVPKVNPYLVRVNTDERIMITKQTFKLGKAGVGVDYTIKGNGAISRVHAIITGKDGEYYIKDNKSTNHTFVNGKSIEEGESELLTDECKIVLGDEEFIFKMQ